MFTGLIEEVGTVRQLRRQGEFQRLEIGARRTMVGLRIGDSMGIDGVCQTVVDLQAGSFAVESVEETLKRTTLGGLRVGAGVNLERSLQLQDRLGGHLILGHVDGVGRIRRLQRELNSWILEIETPSELHRYIASKGSIAVDGISLTVVEAGAKGFTVSIIPHTFRHTNLSRRHKGDPVNLEVDIIARYVERLLQTRGESGQGLTFEQLRETGFA